MISGKLYTGQFVRWRSTRGLWREAFVHAVNHTHALVVARIGNRMQRVRLEALEPAVPEGGKT